MFLLRCYVFLRLGLWVVCVAELDIGRSLLCRDNDYSEDIDTKDLNERRCMNDLGFGLQVSGSRG